MRRSPHDVSGQVAVLGSSGDLATEDDVARASQLGTELARQRLTCVVAGDDGVMGAAASATKAAGGTAVAVVPRDKRLVAPALFDAVIDTSLDWVQFSAAIIRSVRGAIVVGGGAGTLAELSIAYLADLPVAFLGKDSLLGERYADKPFDQRDLRRFPAFEEPVKAVEYIVGTAAYDTDEVRDAADTAHFASYPFGAGAEYLQAAFGYRAAKELARYEDASGDHFYYHVGDFLRAASHYLRARRDADDADPGFSAYLLAIALESIGMSLGEAGETGLASVVCRRAAEAYAEGMAFSPVGDQALLRHSEAGLLGDAALYAALDAYARSDLHAARTEAREARRQYERALALHPPYGDGVSSSSFARAIAPVDALDAQLDAQEGK